VEGFLSGFIYNRHGATDINNVVPLIYSEDSNVEKLLAKRDRAVAPPSYINEDLENIEVSQEDIHTNKIKDMMRSLEDHAFEGKNKQFQVFRSFDKDGDGYISYKDFEERVKEAKIHASKKELACMLKMLDKDNKGYIDFKSFQCHFGPNMNSLIKVPENELHLPNLVPNKAKL